MKILARFLVVVVIALAIVAGIYSLSLPTADQPPASLKVSATPIITPQPQPSVSEYSEASAPESYHYDPPGLEFKWGFSMSDGSYGYGYGMSGNAFNFSNMF